MMVFLKGFLLGLCMFTTARSEDLFLPKIDILSEIQDLKTSVALLKEEVKTLREGQPKIAFTATLGVSGSRGHIGPFLEDTTVVFPHVKTNIGNGYNTVTGVFTAPARGIYFFTFNCFAGASKPASSVLFKNDERIVSLWDQPSSGDHEDNGFNAASLLLEQGDKVYIKLWRNTHISITDTHSKFSGFLLYPY